MPNKASALARYGDDEFLAAVVSLPGWEPKYDEHGQPLPEPFDDALKMQQVGRQRVRKR